MSGLGYTKGSMILTAVRAYVYVYVESWARVVVVVVVVVVVGDDRILNVGCHASQTGYMQLNLQEHAMSERQQQPGPSASGTETWTIEEQACVTILLHSLKFPQSAVRRVGPCRTRWQFLALAPACALVTDTPSFTHTRTAACRSTAFWWGRGRRQPTARRRRR